MIKLPVVEIDENELFKKWVWNCYSLTKHVMSFGTRVWNSRSSTSTAVLVGDLAKQRVLPVKYTNISSRPKRVLCVSFLLLVRSQEETRLIKRGRFYGGWHIPERGNETWSIIKWNIYEMHPQIAKASK